LVTDRPATCVIAQQYSSAAFVPLRVHFREEKVVAFRKCYYLNFVTSFQARKFEIALTLNCVIRWEFLYFRYLRTGISGTYAPEFQVHTHRHFMYLRNGISGTYAPAFQVPTHRYFRYYAPVLQVLCTGIPGTHAPAFQVPTHGHFRYIRTGISGTYAPAFKVHMHRHLRYLRTGISGTTHRHLRYLRTGISGTTHRYFARLISISMCQSKTFVLHSTIFGCSRTAD